MIPNKFKFTIKNGTGIIYNAEYNYERFVYDIIWKNYKTFYTFDEVKEFLSKGGWQIYD